MQTSQFHRSVVLPALIFGASVAAAVMIGLSVYLPSKPVSAAPEIGQPTSAAEVLRVTVVGTRQPEVADAGAVVHAGLPCPPDAAQPIRLGSAKGAAPRQMEL